MKKNHNLVKIIIILLLIFILFLVVNKFIPRDPKTKAEKKLYDLAEKFYGHYYDAKYDSSKPEEIKEILDKYKETGLTIDLEDLEIYLDTFNIEDYSALDKCNKQGTKVTVYPKSPYSKKDFEISYILNCNF